MELPIGLAMALGMDTKAMEAFAAMPHEKQRVIIERAQGAQSREEMRSIVNRIKSNF